MLDVECRSTYICTLVLYHNAIPTKFLLEGGVWSYSKGTTLLIPLSFTQVSRLTLPSIVSFFLERGRDISIFRKFSRIAFDRFYN